MDTVSDVELRAATTSEWQQKDPPFPLKSLRSPMAIPNMATLNRPRASKVPKSTKRVTASDIESNDGDQQPTNGASIPVQALDRNANGVPLDVTVINARGCKRTGGKRIAQRRVYGPQP